MVKANNWAALRKKLTVGAAASSSSEKGTNSNSASAADRSELQPPSSSTAVFGYGEVVRKSAVDKAERAANAAAEMERLKVERVPTHISSKYVGLDCEMVRLLTQCHLCVY